MRWSLRLHILQRSARKRHPVNRYRPEPWSTQKAKSTHIKAAKYKLPNSAKTRSNNTDLSRRVAAREYLFDEMPVEQLFGSDRCTICSSCRKKERSDNNNVQPVPMSQIVTPLPSPASTIKSSIHNFQDDFENESNDEDGLIWDDVGSSDNDPLEDKTLVEDQQNRKEKTFELERKLSIANEKIHELKNDFFNSNSKVAVQTLELEMIRKKYLCSERNLSQHIKELKDEIETPNIFLQSLTEKYSLLESNYKESQTSITKLNKTIESKQSEFDQHILSILSVRTEEKARATTDISFWRDKAQTHLDSIKSLLKQQKDIEKLAVEMEERISDVSASRVKIMNAIELNMDTPTDPRNPKSGGT